MRHNQEVLIVPNGGLGNQLFQVAAGLYLSEDKELSLIQNLGNPRLSSKSMPVVCDFQAPYIEVSQDFHWRYFRRITNFLLSFGQNSQRSMKMKIILKLMGMIMSFLLSTTKLAQIGTQICVGL